MGPNVLVRELPPGDEATARFLFATPPTRRVGRSALYNFLAVEEVATVVDQHILGGRVVRRLIHSPTSASAATRPTAEDETESADGSEGDAAAGASSIDSNA